MIVLIIFIDRQTKYLNKQLEARKGKTNLYYIEREIKIILAKRRMKSKFFITIKELNNKKEKRLQRPEGDNKKCLRAGSNHGP